MLQKLTGNKLTRKPRVGLLLTSLVATCVLAAGCDVDVEDEGRLPDVDVEATPGEMPDVDVRGPDVDAHMEEKKVTVPDVDVHTEEETISVPDIDVDFPDEDDPERG